MKKKNVGFSLIEILISLSVIFVMLVGGFYLYTKNANETKINETTQFLNSSSAQIRNSDIDYSGLNNSDLFSLGVITDDNTKNKFGGEIIFNGSKKGFSFDLTNISHSNCIAILNRTSNSYNLANETPIISKNIGALSALCQDDQLSLAYQYNLDIKNIDLPNSQIDHANVVLYPDGADRKNSTYVLMTGGGLSIQSNNSENDMNKYLANKTGVADEMKTPSTSTGYKNPQCGNFSNGASCGNVTLEQYLNELLNAPDEMWNDANVELKTTDMSGREMKDSDIKSICSQFTCTKKDDTTYTLSKK